MTFYMEGFSMGGSNFAIMANPLNNSEMKFLGKKLTSSQSNDAQGTYYLNSTIAQTTLIQAASINSGFSIASIAEWKKAFGKNLCDGDLVGGIDFFGGDVSEVTMNDNYEFMSITAKNKSGGKCQLIKEPLSNASQNKYVERLVWKSYI
jgi:hypothetical protein